MKQKEHLSERMNFDWNENLRCCAIEIPLEQNLAKGVHGIIYGSVGSGYD